MQNYKFPHHIVLWNVFFAIICVPTGGWPTLPQHVDARI
jgi:hypothetical protein